MKMLQQMIHYWMFMLSVLQSQPKVVGTLELDHKSPIPPNQCWKISRFFQQKGKKSPDYQHCKWGEGRTCLVSQLFCPGLYVCRKDYKDNDFSFYYFCYKAYMNYLKDLCISRTFLLEFWVKNRGCSLYTRPWI